VRSFVYYAEIPALFDEKPGNPNLIRRGEWGSGDEATICRRQESLGAVPSARRFSELK